MPSPLLPQAMLKARAIILGVKGASKQHCKDSGGGMREFVEKKKCPNTFGQDCSSDAVGFMYRSQLSSSIHVQQTLPYLDFLFEF